MGKRKRQRLSGAPNRRSTKLQAKHAVVTQPNRKPNPNPDPSKLKSEHHAQHSLPIIPFSATDRILLIGEGDLSFARSLMEHHECRSVTATVLEKNFEELSVKYPQVVDNVTKIEEMGGTVLFGVDAAKMGPWLDKAVGREWKVGAMDRVVFNFPHVGGKSTDVNRQVRYNQELLVSFFQRALTSLAPGGSITVTLFEGEPYTLWNIRDLARHSGLQVERSFKFQSSAYPGYHHARTLGVVKSRTGQAGAGWKGEDRLARSYVFVHKSDQPMTVSSKRKREDDGSTDDEGDED